MRVPIVIATFITLLAAGAVAAGPQEGGAKKEGYGEEKTYGHTPEVFVPYRGSGKAYWHYFQNPLIFRGPGREKPAPAEMKSVKIGLIAPVEDAPDSDIGQSMLRGVTMAFDEANAAGGFKGRWPYEIVLRNDSGLWGASSNTFVDLAYKEKVWTVLGSLGAANTHIALRVALKAEVSMVNTACTDPTLTETAIPWILRTYPDDRQHGYGLARHILLEKGHHRVAIMRANNKFGRMGVGEFTDSARRLGHPVLLEVRYNPGEETFESQIERIRRLNVEAIVLWSSAGDAGRIVRAMRAAGLDQPIFGTDRLVSPVFLAGAGKDAEGVSATYPMDPDRDDETWKEFRRLFQEKFEMEPDAFAAFSYDGARIAIEAMERAGLNRVAIRDQLMELKSYEGVSGPMAFDATANNLGSVYVLQVKDGRFVRSSSR